MLAGYYDIFYICWCVWRAVTVNQTTVINENMKSIHLFSLK